MKVNITSRGASLTSILLVIVFIIFNESGCKMDHNEERIRVLSYNIRYASDLENKEDWDERREGVYELLKGYDFIGLQEVLPEQYDDLVAKFNDEYNFIYRTREAELDRGEGVPILYDSKKWVTIDSGFFWLSETPETPGSKSWEAALPRIATWGIFQHRKSSDSLMIINVHLDHVSEEARFKSLVLIKERFDKELVRYPIILLGDFNFKDTTQAYSYILKNLRLTDSYREVHEYSSAKQYTFTGWESDSGISRIDYIFVNDEFEVINSDVIREKYKDIYPSDHLPLVSIVEMVNR